MDRTVAGERFNVKVSAVELADYDFDGAPFAAITLWHVLEHLDEPVSQLARLASMLAPDGIIAIEVPNAGGFSARRSGSAWPSLEPAVHINQFAPASLRTALETAGLRPAQIGTVAITPYLRPLDRLRPHHLVFRAQSLRALHTLSSEHPSGYELLRTVATKA